MGKKKNRKDQGKNRLIPEELRPMLEELVRKVSENDVLTLFKNCNVDLHRISRIRPGKNVAWPLIYSVDPTDLRWGVKLSIYMPDGELVEKLERPKLTFNQGAEDEAQFLKDNTIDTLCVWIKAIDSQVRRIRSNKSPNSPDAAATPTPPPAAQRHSQELLVDEPLGGSKPPAAVVTGQNPPGKAKRSTQRGEGRAKLIAALTKHHEYASGGCLNTKPVGNNELARLAGVSESTASDFFKKEFKGFNKYRYKCQNTGALCNALKALRGEFTPAELFQMNIEAYEAGQRNPDEE
jgi:hypothetical protein